MIPGGINNKGDRHLWPDPGRNKAAARRRSRRGCTGGAGLGAAAETPPEGTTQQRGMAALAMFSLS